MKGGGHFLKSVAHFELTHIFKLTYVLIIGQTINLIHGGT